MAKINSKTAQVLVRGLVAAVLGAMVLTSAVHAQQAGKKRVIRGERYVPTIWVDPDGCEHWVMDDGVEGYMTPHLTRQGKPVCRESRVCGVVYSDQYFASNSARISKAGQTRLRTFFQTTDATGFIIAGHTDSRASDKHNMDLSLRRANSVASVAKSAGVRVVDVQGYGERKPVASNASAAGMAKNRRVEIVCIK